MKDLSQSPARELLYGFNNYVRELMKAPYTSVLLEELAIVEKATASAQELERPPDDSCRVETYSVKKVPRHAKHLQLAGKLDQQTKKESGVREFYYLHIVCDKPIFDATKRKGQKSTKVRTKHIRKDNIDRGQRVLEEYSDSPDYQQWAQRFANQKLLDLLTKKRELLLKQLADQGYQPQAVNGSMNFLVETHRTIDSSGDTHNQQELPKSINDIQAMEDRWQEVERQRYEYLKSLSLPELANYLNLHYKESVPTERERIFQKIRRDKYRETELQRREYLTKEGLIGLTELANYLNLHYKEAEMAERKGFFKDIAVSANTLPPSCLYTGGYTEYGNFDVTKSNSVTYYKPPFELTAEQKRYLRENVTLTRLQACEKLGITPSKFDRLKKKYQLQYVEKMPHNGFYYYLYRLADLEEIAAKEGLKSTPLALESEFKVLPHNNKLDSPLC